MTVFAYVMWDEGTGQVFASKEAFPTIEAAQDAALVALNEGEDYPAVGIEWRDPLSGTCEDSKSTTYIKIIGFPM